MVESGTDRTLISQELPFANVQITVGLRLPLGQDIVGDCERGLAGVVAVLQACGHELDLVLVTGDLGQEAPARADHRHVDHAELLKRRVGQGGHSFYGLLGIAFMVQGHKVGLVRDPLAALREPGGADGHPLGLRYGVGVQDLDLDLIHGVPPPRWRG